MKYYCDYCGLSFKRKVDLKNHILWHLNPDLYTCRECNRSNHIKSYLFKTKYECSECNHYFCNSYNLTRHMKIHTRNYQCKYCGNLHSCKKNLKTHISISHAFVLSKRQQCNLCKVWISTKGNLKRHLSTKHFFQPKFGSHNLGNNQSQQHHDDKDIEITEDFFLY